MGPLLELVPFPVPFRREGPLRGMMTRSRNEFTRSREADKVALARHTEDHDRSLSAQNGVSQMGVDTTWDRSSRLFLHHPSRIRRADLTS